jgi:hypothetical protein
LIDENKVLLDRSGKNNGIVNARIEGIEDSYLRIKVLFNGGKKKRKPRPNSKKRFFNDQSQIDTLKTFIINGEKLPYIARFFKCSKRTVRRAINSNEEIAEIYYPKEENGVDDENQ